MLAIQKQTLAYWYLKTAVTSDFSLLRLAVAGSQQYHQQQKTCRRLLVPPHRSSHAAHEVCRGYPPRLYHRQGAEAEETPAKLQSIPGGARVIFWSEGSWGREGERYFFAERKADLSSITNVTNWDRKPTIY